MSEPHPPIMFRQPATRWEEALPVGNGLHGALLFGNRAREQLILNHAALWLPALPYPRARRSLAHLLPEVRRLLLAGRADEAEALWLTAARDAGWMYVYSDPCHPGGVLGFDADVSGDVGGYRRTLDCAAGLARAAWREGGAAVRREAFVSRADDVIVLRLSADQPGRIGGRLALDALPYADASIWVGTTYPTLDPRGWAGTAIPVADLLRFERRAGDGWLDLHGTYTHGGSYGVLARVLAQGGTVAVDDGGLRITAADEVLVLAGIYAKTDRASGESALRRRLAALEPSFDSLRARHEALHRELFTRCTFSLAGAENDARSAEERLLAADADDVPPRLVQDLWAFGRYLFVSATHPEGRYPPHLQGIWTGTWRPAWFGNYTLDENVQMCHWLAEPGQLGELTGPLRRYVRASLDDWRANARDLFGCGGVLAPLMQSNDCGRADCAEWHFYLSGAGWVASHLWDRWAFSGDAGVLRDEVLPVLTAIAEFYRDYLVDGPDGRAWFAPSLSVENRPSGWPARTAINATMDVAVCREVLTRLCAARDTLGLDRDETASWRRLCDRLPDLRVNADGALAEWIHPDLHDHYHHRHVSHLYPLFPGDQITPEGAPELFAAAREAVDRRRVIGLTSQTSWSLAHLAHLYARLGDGPAAWHCLSVLIRACVQANLFTVHNDWRAMGLTMGGLARHGAFQIEANLGFTSAVQEMLVASTASGVTVLPALPAQWCRGALCGLATRCGAVVDLRWDLHARQVTVTLRSRVPRQVEVRLGVGPAAPMRGVEVGPSPVTVEFPLPAAPHAVG